MLQNFSLQCDSSVIQDMLLLSLFKNIVYANTGLTTEDETLEKTVRNILFFKSASGNLFLSLKNHKISIRRHFSTHQIQPEVRRI